MFCSVNSRCRTRVILVGISHGTSVITDKQISSSKQTSMNESIPLFAGDNLQWGSSWSTFIAGARYNCCFTGCFLVQRNQGKISFFLFPLSKSGAWTNPVGFHMNAAWWAHDSQKWHLKYLQSFQMFVVVSGQEEHRVSADSLRALYIRSYPVRDVQSMNT